VRGGGAEAQGAGRVAPAAASGAATRSCERYVFPDGELVPLGTLLASPSAPGLEARDVEGLREHYARTLRCWVARLEAAHAEAAALVGEHTIACGRLYMAGTILGFESGRLTLIQTLFAKPLPGGAVVVPASRADLYRP
jgi:cyclopropane-fatty-acyl-phospholipid synthase